MNQAIRPEVSKLVVEVKSKSGTEHIENALEYNECIRDAWTELWVNNAYRNAPKIIEIFKTRAADMSFIERKDIEPYWEAAGISALELYKDKRNLPVLKTIGLTDEDIQTLFNAFPNLNTITDKRLIKMLPSVLNFFGQLRKMTPAMILGSGASLDKVSPLLSNWKGGIFCSSSQLSLLTYYKVKPTFVTIIDADPSMNYLIDQYDSSNVPLLTHPCIDPYIIEHWKGPIWFFRMNDPGDPWFGKYMPIMLDKVNPEKNLGVRSFVINSGCVVNVNIAIAQYLGYFPIFLAGVDWAATRFTDMQLRDGVWTKILPPPISSRAFLSRANNGMITHKVAIFYKYSQMVIYGLDAPQLISCSDGINTELPYADPKEVIEKQGRGFEKLYRTPPECYKVAHEYLYPRGVYILKSPKSVRIMNKDSLKTRKQKWQFRKDYAEGKLKGWW